ncbi:MAG: 1-deoxy-D-xylulose-5-phosphate reductoisomerase [Acholeplasmataceae bacterium]|nr:1-deoxy-D-xylulose-5-phosphate reductoisomerase [Acholeplasmataceae bacterium]
MKGLYLLGATGSIGSQTLAIIKEHPHELKLIGCSLGRDHQKNDTILKTFQPEIAVIRYETDLERYQKHYPHIHFVSGDEGLIELAMYDKPGLLINALTGSVGLAPTMKAIEMKKDIALANKETLVMAGDLIKKQLKKYHVKLFPIDSEHSAIWQTLLGEDRKKIQKIVITASGGALRDLSREELETVTVQEALKHPNWFMGAKITIDSATMMNKGLEVIEAHHLFDLEYHQIETVLHDESVVHGLTYFIDGTIKASLSVSDMTIPIQYALFYPDRKPYPKSLALTNLTFKPMDFKRYPLLKLAYEVGQKGGIYPTVLNAANEAAVRLFLANKISFLEIETIIFDAVEKAEPVLNVTLETIISTDRRIQKTITESYEKR